MAITFDVSSAPSLYIVLDAAQTEYTAQEIYSRWKEWAIDDNAQWPSAYRVIGGDPVTSTLNAPSFYFQRNDLGWFLRDPESDGEFSIVGNIVAQDTDINLHAPPIGDFSPSVRIILTQVATDSGGSTVAASHCPLPSIEMLIDEGDILFDYSDSPICIEVADNTPILTEGDDIAFVYCDGAIEVDLCPC